MVKIKIGLVQLNPLVGDIDGNMSLILSAISAAEQQGADILVFSELVLCGYPPEDLLLRNSLELRVEKALERLTEVNADLICVLGYPRRIGDKLYNAAGVWRQGKCLMEYAKHSLPNYQVFDEKRYFQSGDSTVSFVHKGVSFGVNICEDIWDDGRFEDTFTADVEVLLNLNASPFHYAKQNERDALVSRRAQEHELGIVYVNQLGGQDELVFDGGSFVCESNGQTIYTNEYFNEGIGYVVYTAESKTFSSSNHQLSSELREQHLKPSLAHVYQALVLGVRDYVNKNGFKGVVLGLSGGVDSALTLAIAVDALGPDRVSAVMMPFKYTSQMSRDDAAEQARVMGVSYQSIPIVNIFKAFSEALAETFTGLEKDTTEENLQARSRGVLLMAISNKLGYLVLTTGNKSEMSVGYATLYGDMAGGLDVLKDVPKTQVFELCRYRNSIHPVIPERVITRPPSAELAPDQVDEDSLPPYDILDQILEFYIEQDQSADAIIAKGFNEQDVKKVIRLVDINEYKRRQAPIGIRLTERAFGRDRRYPITNGWKPGI